MITESQQSSDNSYFLQLDNVLTNRLAQLARFEDMFKMKPQKYAIKPLDINDKTLINNLHNAIAYSMFFINNENRIYDKHYYLFSFLFKTFFKYHNVEDICYRDLINIYLLPIKDDIYLVRNPDKQIMGVCYYQADKYISLDFNNKALLNIQRTYTITQEQFQNILSWS